MRVFAVRFFVLVVLGATLITPAHAETQTLGWVGCSNIRNAVQGYDQLGGTRFWVPLDGNKTYHGGTVTRWGSNNLQNTYWTQFTNFYNQRPTDTIWWGLCSFPPTQGGETDDSNYNSALRIRAELERRIPGVTVYVSAINDFVAPHTCDVTGPDGPARMRALADRLVAEGRALPGPVLRPLVSIYQTPSAGATTKTNQTKKDGCHPNKANLKFQGQPVFDFFH